MYDLIIYLTEYLFLRSKDPESKFITDAWLERVIIYGIKPQPKLVRIESSDYQSVELDFTYDENGKTLLIRKPGININVDFAIILE